MKHCKKLAAIASALLVLGFTACSSDGDGGSGSDDSIQTGIPVTGKPAGTTPKTKTTEVSKPTGATGITGSTGITASGTPTTNRTPSPNGLVKPTYKTVYNVTEDTYMAKIDEIIARLNANDPSQPKEFEFKFTGTNEIGIYKFRNDYPNAFHDKVQTLYTSNPNVRIGLDFSSAKVSKEFIERESVFESRNAYRSIVLPKKVSENLTLGAYYFDSCYNLEYVKLPDNLKAFPNGGKKIFALFSNPTTVELKVEISASIESIESNNFQDAKNITTVFLNEGLKSIGTYSFADAERLKTVKIPSTLKTIGDQAFSGCTTLTNINLNNGLEEIGKKAFYECTSLETIELPSSLLSIGNYAFTHTKLKKVIIPESVDTMGTGIFWNCHELETVEIYAPIIGTDVLAVSDVKSLVIGEKVIEIGTDNFVSTLTSVIFKNPEGWKCDGVPVDSAILKDPAAAATYLKTNKDKVFTRQ